MALVTSGMMNFIRAFRFQRFGAAVQEPRGPHESYPLPAILVECQDEVITLQCHVAVHGRRTQMREPRRHSDPVATGHDGEFMGPLRPRFIFRISEIAFSKNRFAAMGLRPRIGMVEFDDGLRTDRMPQSVGSQKRSRRYVL